MDNFPTRDAILNWIAENPDKSTKREIARAFGVRGDDRVILKALLKELKDEGLLSRSNMAKPKALPPVTILRISRINADGDLLAIPVDEDMPKEELIFTSQKKDPALVPGDRVLARIVVNKHGNRASLIRKLSSAPERILGILRVGNEGMRISPVDKKNDKEWLVPAGESLGAQAGELVEAEQIGPKTRMGLPKARIVERLGDPTAPKSVSLIAIKEHGIPNEFPQTLLSEVETLPEATLEGRMDLRHLPLITIDPSDARDHDDAICAFPDEDQANPGGHIIWVAIADVAYYVRSGTELDREARHRGNSSYFPDRVVPMLPDRLSGDLCSLHEGVDRPALALEIKIDAYGNKLKHRFHRAMIRSPASLSYEEAQSAIDGAPNERSKEFLDPVLKPLWAAYRATERARDKRQPLHLDLPERKIMLSPEGKVLSVNFRDRFDAHKLVEEFMVMANVCAAETLEQKKTEFLYRVHEEPNPDKLDALRETLEPAGLKLAKGQVLKTRHLNQLLDAAAGTEFSEHVNMSVLRSMTQAYYSPENFGHFGLNLMRYAHFTSPIRRYADLIIHRALISALNLGQDGLSTQDRAMIKETAEHISMTERRSMLAERDTTDRYLAAYLSDRVGTELSGQISGIARFGLFVKLDDSGADGLVPLSTLGREYWIYNQDQGTLTGERTGKILAVGMKAEIRLLEASPITGGLVFELLSVEGKNLPAPSKPKGKGRKFSSRKPSSKRSRKK